MPAANKDSLNRVLTMMQMIPLYPRWVTAKKLHSGLSDQGFSVTKRTIERDLIRFSTQLGLTSVDSPEGFKWSYARDNNVSFVPSLSIAEALSLKMAQKHLSFHLPPFLFTSMQAIFNKADRVLSSNQALNQWPSKVSVLPPGIPIKPHSNDPEILATLYRGLMENRKVSIRYFKNKRFFKVALLGLIVRDNKLVFICRYEGFEDIRMILAHRIHDAVLLDETHKDETDVQSYTLSGQPGAKLTTEEIRLEIEVTGYVKLLLSESKVGKDQTLDEIDENWSKAAFTLPHTQELEHWLMANIASIKIISPTTVRERVVEKLTKGLKQNG